MQIFINNYSKYYHIHNVVHQCCSHQTWAYRRPIWRMFGRLVGSDPDSLVILHTCGVQRPRIRPALDLGSGSKGRFIFTYSLLFTGNFRVCRAFNPICHWLQMINFQFEYGKMQCWPITHQLEQGGWLQVFTAGVRFPKSFRTHFIILSSHINHAVYVTHVVTEKQLTQHISTILT
jgi:hypothetical protein